MSEVADAAPPASIRGGNILHGKYRLERELGRGAMGTVWSAIHLSLDQRVAIKVISSDYANSAEAIQRFHTEAKAAAKLRSRYVVQVYDDGETPEGLPYIVMEYLEGESLEDRIAREGDVPLAEAVRITTHVGRALTRAHGRGIVHRDLKPANIFITKNEDDDMGWVAKVLDFGIAKLDDNREKSTTKTGTVLGTPLFMSAEQVRGASNVDARADLYSLGMVFYNMLTGRYAFEGTSFGDLLVSICTDPLPSLCQHAPWASHALDQWFQKACARDVAARFQNADIMIDELYAAANLSFDGRMSFADENSSLTEMVIANREQLAFKAAGDTGNEARNDYAIAATQHAMPELATNTGDPSVRTIPGVPEKKRWLVPSLLAGAALVAAAAALWFMSSRTPAPIAGETREAAAAEPKDMLVRAGDQTKEPSVKAVANVEEVTPAEEPSPEEPASNAAAPQATQLAPTAKTPPTADKSTSALGAPQKKPAHVKRPAEARAPAKSPAKQEVKKNAAGKSASTEVDIGF